MWWWFYEWWGPWLALMVVCMVLCFAFMAVMMRGSGRGMGWAGMGRMCGFGRWGSDSGDPNSILDERLARGEIGVEEHRELSTALSSTRTSGHDA
jgi:hypothetical protein